MHSHTPCQRNLIHKYNVSHWQLHISLQVVARYDGVDSALLSGHSKVSFARIIFKNLSNSNNVVL